MDNDYRTHRVLVIDDTVGIHKAIRRMLRGCRAGTAGAHAASQHEPGQPPMQFAIDSAYQGQDGVALVRQAASEGRPYTLAFVDLRMPPGWDGLETIEHLWAEVPECNVVICTGYSDHSWADIVSRLGANERLLLLKKPFEAVEVLQIVHNLAHRYELLQRIQRETARRQQMEIELRHAQRMESVGHLAAGIAHEISTPIQFIHDSMWFLNESFDDFMQVIDCYRNAHERCHCSNADVMSPKSLERKVDVRFMRQEVPEAVARVFDGLQRVATIVGAMKQFSHPGETTKQEVDLNQAIRDTLTIARSEYKSIANVVTHLHNIPPVVCASQEITQVILNLVINAAHAIEELDGPRRQHGKITVTTRHDGGFVEIVIEDNGIGISENIRSRIFDPFFTTKEVGKGTGQGLAIAWSVIVDKHAGKLSVESVEHEGTTFTVRLPVTSQRDVVARAV